MDASVEAMITRFCQLQLSQALATGSQIGLSPITTASTLLQTCAASLAGIDQAGAIAILRAYADCIEAGPGQGAAQSAARARFTAAAEAFVAAAQSARDFPAPQGRA